MPLEIENKGGKKEIKEVLMDLNLVVREEKRDQQLMTNPSS